MSSIPNVQKEPKRIDGNRLLVQEPDIIDVSERMRDLEEVDDDHEMDVDDGDKENVRPEVEEKREQVDSNRLARNVVIRAEYDLNQKRALEATRFSETAEVNDHKQTKVSEIDILCLRRPDLNSSTMFYPNLLGEFDQAFRERQILTEAEGIVLDEAESEQEPPLKSRRIDLQEGDDNPLLACEERCTPAADAGSVVLYTASLRGIQKTFEDCNNIRFLLDDSRVTYSERDISMHMEFNEELWELLDCKALPPRLFIEGRYIGGAEEILALHEQGKLKPLLDGVSNNRFSGTCEGCGSIRFVLCFKCNGSHKIVEENGQWKQCSVCNENGLIICPLCC